MPGKGRPFQAGHSGNPKGRPPKDRALTTILERAGSKTVEVGDKKVSGKNLVAALVWQGITTRQIEFPDGDKMKLQPYHWLELVKWMYGHIDGPPKQGPSGAQDDPVHQVSMTATEWKALETERLAQAGATLTLFEEEAEGGDA